MEGIRLSTLFNLYTWPRYNITTLSVMRAYIKHDQGNSTLAFTHSYHSVMQLCISELSIKSG